MTSGASSEVVVTSGKASTESEAAATATASAAVDSAAGDSPTLGEALLSGGAWAASLAAAGARLFGVGCLAGRCRWRCCAGRLLIRGTKPGGCSMDMSGTGRTVVPAGGPFGCGGGTLKRKGELA